MALRPTIDPMITIMVNNVPVDVARDDLETALLACAEHDTFWGAQFAVQAVAGCGAYEARRLISAAVAAIKQGITDPYA